ncbi:MAG: hypothetical protein QOJ39_2412 [Candidatus Eremiobacteraeota bacterium]|nr:hypothetical protein [Candidatus Eremiobacteraeota bacterium]
MLDDAIAELVRARWGSSAAITGSVPLSARASLSVRAALSGPGAPDSIIVKHVRAEELGADLSVTNPEFLEELAAHRFLRAAGAEARLKPALIADDPRGIMVFEDLGREPYVRMRTFEELVPMLATAIARLHTAGAPRIDAYLDTRAALGLAGDRRRYGTPAQASRVERAARAVLRESGALGVARELDDVLACIADPGAFRTVVHDDLGNARQTFEVGHALYLLDFEYAKVGHALLDLGKPMIGKFEVHLESGVYGWTCPRFPIELAGAYRAQRAQLGGTEFDDAAWRRALAASLLWTGLSLIGRLATLEPDRNLLGTVPQNANGIVARTLELVEPLAEFPQLCAALRDALSRASWNFAS